MSNKKIRPITPEERAEGHRYLAAEFPEETLCQTIREIHKAANDPAITDLCAAAIYKAKRLVSRLDHYKKIHEGRSGGCD